MVVGPHVPPAPDAPRTCEGSPRPSSATLVRCPRPLSRPSPCLVEPASDNCERQFRE